MWECFPRQIFPTFNVLIIYFGWIITKKNNVTGAPNSALTAAVRQLLRPLVGVLLDNGLTYGWLSKMLKVIFVDVAESEFGLTGKPQTDSRVSLLTGVHRKDVKRIRAEDKVEFEPPSSIFLGARLVSIWTSEPRFLDQEGNPAPLNRFASSGGVQNEPSFEELVVMVNKDIRPRAILDEWLRLGAVTINAKNQVCLETAAFIPNRGFEEKSYYLGRNLHDHLAAARANVATEDPPFIERSVYYDQLTEDSVKELHALSRQKGMELLQYLNDEAKKLQLRDAEAGGRKLGENKKRMNFGIYFYSDDD